MADGEEPHGLRAQQDEPAPHRDVERLHEEQEEPPLKEAACRKGHPAEQEEQGEHGVG